MKQLLRNLALASIVAAPAFYASAEITGSGTESDPYVITTAEDLNNAYKKVRGQAAKIYYFVQAADIDMASYKGKDYLPLNGSDGVYSSAIHYDGQRHVIKNFGPKAAKDNAGSTGQAGADDYKAYVTSIFGVMNGTVKNLGVVDADIDMSKFDTQTYGLIGGYVGHGDAAALVTENVIENVYVTGKIKVGGKKYCGVFVGTTAGQPLKITNCFANVSFDVNKVEEGASTTNGVFVGRPNTEVTLTNCYAAGTVAGNAGLITGTGKVAVKINNVVAFNTGSASIAQGGGEGVKVATDATKVALAQEITGWDGYSDAIRVEGLPGLYYNFQGEGTKEKPYLINNATDLCHAWTMMLPAKNIYFEQTADIDMAGVENYTAINGFRGAWPDDITTNIFYGTGAGGGYSSGLVYDGKNHVITNFAPKDRKPEVENQGYYCQSLFGVMSGEVHDLGVIDAKIVGDNGLNMGYGILGGYVGHSNYKGNGATDDVTYIDNVFVTGSVTGGGTKYAGGMFGTNAGPLDIYGCYSDVEVAAAYAGGIIGRTDKVAITLNDVYVRAEATGTSSGAIAFATRGRAPEIEATNVYAFGTGDAVASDVVVKGEIKKEATITPEAIAAIQAWEYFNEKKMNENGTPALNWQTADQLVSGIDQVATDNIDNSNAPIEYFNLQGVRVQNPANGLYIKRQGTKISKVVIR